MASRHFVSAFGCPVGPKSYLINGTLDLMVLSVLRHRGLHAMEIADAIERRSVETLSVSHDHLFRSLHVLVEKAWIHEVIKPAGEKHTFYVLTPKGRRALETERAAWERLSEAVEKVVIETNQSRMSGNVVRGEDGRRRFAA